MKKMKVAFIAHPLTVGMLATIVGFEPWFIKLFDKNFVRQILKKTKPFIFLRFMDLVSKTGKKIDFIAVACPLLPDQMVTLDEEFVLQRIVDAVKVAKNDGAEIVSLGGFTSVIGNEGQKVAEAVDISVTSGNTFTASLAIRGIIEAAKAVRLDLDRAHCAVIGATGDIGSACTKFLAGRVRSMALGARNEKKMGKFADEISKFKKIDITIHKRTEDAIKNADVILSATSALTTIIDPLKLKAGAIVCDVALPANIAREVSRIRKDVLVFEGGLSKMYLNDQVKNKKWDALMPSNGIYGCLAEALLLGFENRKENYSIGRGNISQEKIKEILNIAEKHGYGLSNFFCGDKFYSQDDMSNFSKIIVKNNHTQELKSYVDK